MGSSIIANNTAIDPDSYTNKVVAGSIADGSGWSINSGIGGNGGTAGTSWAIGATGSSLYFGFGDGTASNSLQTFMRTMTNRDLALVPDGGNVGIGTTSPGYLLQVNSGALPTASQLRTTANGAGGISLLAYQTDNNAIGFDVDYASSAWYARDTSAGLFYKTSDAFLFHGNTGLTANTAYTPTERMRIDFATGNVGIGTTAPGEKLDINGRMIRQISRASGIGEDGKDNGQITSRVLTINKKHAGTSIRIGYSDVLRVMGVDKGCFWEIRVDGVSCPGGSHIFDIFTADGANVHRPNSYFGYCDGLSTGSHEIQIWVTSSLSNGAHSGGDCYTGLRSSRWTIEAEEVY